MSLTQYVNAPIPLNSDAMPVFIQERISMAFQILGGIPESRLKLHMWFQELSGDLGCGTVACIGGWMSVHPYFQALGLTRHNKSPRVVGTEKFDVTALAEIFLHEKARSRDSAYGDGFMLAGCLFDSRGDGDWDSYLMKYAKEGGYEITDKSLGLMRLKYAYDYFSAPLHKLPGLPAKDRRGVNNFSVEFPHG